MLNLTDNWAHLSAAAGHPHSAASAAAANMLANNSAHQGQYSAMWNLSPSNTSCAMSQYLRSSAAYLPTTHSVVDPPSSVAPSLAMGVTSAEAILTHAHTQPAYHDAHAQSSVLDSSASSLSAFPAAASRDLKSAHVTSSWTLTHPSL